MGASGCSSGANDSGPSSVAIPYGVEGVDAASALEVSIVPENVTDVGKTSATIGGGASERTIMVQQGAPPLYADERAVKQILINLVSNAVKFTPTGGRIEVVGGKSATGDFQIMVRDNGPGIPRDKLDNIFQPFNQVDNRFDRQAGGTGLGLALVRGLAELHGGRAWMESEFGRGCSVFVSLPAKQEKAAAAA